MPALQSKTFLTSDGIAEKKGQEASPGQSCEGNVLPRGKSAITSCSVLGFEHFGRQLVECGLRLCETLNKHAYQVTSRAAQAI
jgi:hypothetical protein